VEWDLLDLGHVAGGDERIHDVLPDPGVLLGADGVRGHRDLLDVLERAPGGELGRRDLPLLETGQPPEDERRRDAEDDEQPGESGLALHSLGSEGITTHMMM
jgi:hypothetical protein